MFYDSNRDDSYDVPAESFLGNRYCRMFSGFRIFFVLLLKEQERNRKNGTDPLKNLHRFLFSSYM